MARRLTLALMLSMACALAGASAAPAAVQTVVVGDSLAVGTRPYLAPLVPDFPLTWDAVSGRTTPQGMRALRSKLRRVRPGAVVVSLGSNDGPSAARFADRIRRTLGAIPRSACVVWPTIVRPPRKGDEAGLNRALRRAARRDRRVVLVDWVGAVSTGRVVLPDGLHPDPAGYAERSRMIAAALQDGCDGEDAGPEQAQGGAPAPV